MTGSTSKLIGPRRVALVVCALAAQLLLVARASHAQSGEPSSATPDALREVIDLPIMDIRSEEEIGKLRTETAERLRVLQVNLDEAKRSQESGRARVQVQKKSIEKLKADQELADKQGTGVPKKTAEAQVKHAESALKLLGQYDKMLSARIDALGAQRDSHQALLDALDREAAVASLSNQMSALVEKEGIAASSRLGTMQNELTKLERSSLEGLKERTEKEKTAAEKLYKLMEERLTFAEMRSDFLTGK